MTSDGGELSGGDRDENSLQRADRNWLDILQELRVAQAGTQILTGFLLTIAFQPRFAELDGYQRGLYLALIVVSVVTTALSLLPVAVHRSLFRRQVKATTVNFGDVVLRFVLGGVLVTLTGTLGLILDVVAGRAVGVVAALLFLLVTAGGFVIVAVLARRAAR